jgi:hypothetical protein
MPLMCGYGRPGASRGVPSFSLRSPPALLRPREHIVRTLTKELLIRRTMSGIEVDEVIVAAISHETLAAEQARRADWQRAIESAARFVSEKP